MSERGNLNLDLLLKQCRTTEELDKLSVIENLTHIEKKEPKEAVATIYNYFLLNEKNFDVLLHIIKGINNLRPKECLDTLIDFLLMYKEHENTDEFVNLRVNVIRTISNYKEQKAVLPLLYCLNDKNEHYKVRLYCAEALGKIGDKYAVSPLIDVVSNEDEKSVYLRESAATALGMIGDARAVDALVGILEAKKNFLNKFTFLKERVIEALGKINSRSDRVIKALKESLEDDSPQVRINAIEALMNTESDKSFELIKTMLNDTDSEVIENAVIALYNLHGVDILQEILKGDIYNATAKNQAQSLINEYETDCEEEENNDDKN